MEGSNGNNVLEGDLGEPDPMHLLHVSIEKGDLRVKITLNKKYLVIEAKAILYICGNKKCSEVHRTQSFTSAVLLGEKIDKLIEKENLTEELNPNQTPEKPGQWCIISTDVFVCEI